MDTSPHWRTYAHAFGRWIDPRWRRERAPYERAIAWASVGAALASYLFTFLWLGPSAGSAVTALYAFPCVLAGWAFGASGGIIVALLTAPLHAWLLSVGLLPEEGPGLAAIFGVLSATVVGTSVGIARDLRERLRERSADLAASEDRYRQLVDNSPEGVLVHERGVIVFANPSMARLVGLADPRALVGRTLVTLAPFEDRETFGATFVFGRPDARSPHSVEARLAHGDDPATNVVMTTMPIQYRGSRAQLVLVREKALILAPGKLTYATARAVAT